MNVESINALYQLLKGDHYQWDLFKRDGKRTQNN